MGGTVTGITFGVTGIWLGVTGMRLGPPPFAYGTGVAAATLGDSETGLHWHIEKL